MKKNLNITALPFLVLGAGGIGLTLRVLLYAFAVDDRGLLPRFHPLHLLTLLLTAAVCLQTVYALRHFPEEGNYAFHFPASRSGGVGAFAAAGWLLVVAFSQLDSAADLLSTARALLAFLCVPCLGITGWFRLKGRRPNFWLHGLLCVYFLVHLLCQYRVWSGEPQLADYLYQVFACSALAFTAYCRSAFDVQMGQRRLYLLSALLAVYFCFLSMVSSGDGRFYFGFGAWAFGNLYPLADQPHREVE